MTDPRAEPESSTTDGDTADCNGSDEVLSWDDVRAKLREDYPDRITQADVARALMVSSRGVRRHVDRLGEVQWVQIGGRSFRTYDRATVMRYARTRAKIRISKCAFQGIEVERLEKICETYVRQNLDIAPPELLALAKRIAKL